MKWLKLTNAILVLSVSLSSAEARAPRMIIATRDNVRCIPGKLRSYISEIQNRFGSIQIVSGEREWADNRRRGGRKGSMHLQCKAVDFTVPGVKRSVVKQFLATNFAGRAGIGFYCNNRFHIDVGTPRAWSGKTCRIPRQYFLSFNKNYRYERRIRKGRHHFSDYAKANKARRYVRKGRYSYVPVKDGSSFQ